MTALAAKQLPDFLAARKNMIEGQIRPNKVRDENVLTVLENLPRELFVPEHLAGIAYMDESVPIAPGRYLMAPMILARLLTEATIQPTDKALVVAAGTGYSTAALAKIAGEVVAIEADADLQRRATILMKTLAITNAEIKLAPMQDGWKAGAPYDVIVIDGAVDAVPDALLQQLKDGGRLMAVVRHYGAAHAAHTGEARIYTGSGPEVAFRPLFDANVALLPGFTADAKFTF